MKETERGEEKENGRSERKKLHRENKGEKIEEKMRAKKRGGKTKREEVK